MIYVNEVRVVAKPPLALARPEASEVRHLLVDRLWLCLLCTLTHSVAKPTLNAQLSEGLNTKCNTEIKVVQKTRPSRRTHRHRQESFALP